MICEACGKIVSCAPIDGAQICEACAPAFRAAPSCRDFFCLHPLNASLTGLGGDERVLVTTLTKKMAEELTKYFTKFGVRTRYIHSDVETLERIQIMQDLRVGLFDVLVGVNLLREGLDLPEVSLVAILDADKEGMLRSRRSMIQTVGRAARNINGKAIMYADKITKSMQATIDETNYRDRKSTV